MNLYLLDYHTALSRELTEFDCYYAAVDEFNDRCFNLGRNDYAMRMMNPLVNLCQNNYDVNIIIDAIKVSILVQKS